MQLEHSFTVPVPVQVAWEALLDPERVAPCFPGATLTSIDGPEFSGNVKVRMGPVSLLYKGIGRFTDTNEGARRVVLEAAGKDSRGNGTASATVTATLAEAGENSTKVDVVTDLTVTGRPAQLGRGLIGEVGGRIIDSFASCLATELSSGSGPSGTDDPDQVNARVAAVSTESTAAAVHAPPATDQGRVQPADEIDLLDFTGQPVFKRVVPLLAVLLVGFLVVRWLRRR